MDDCYETKLREFAEGKRLGRLTNTVPCSRDDRCDACGSTQPRTLLGLKDSVNGRYYFVGQNCLAWLMENGMVLEPATGIAQQARTNGRWSCAETVAPRVTRRQA